MPRNTYKVEKDVCLQITSIDLPPFSESSSGMIKPFPKSVSENICCIFQRTPWVMYYFLYKSPSLLWFVINDKPGI